MIPEPKNTVNFLERYWQLSYRYARAHGASREEAEDFAQNTWIWKFALQWQGTLEHFWKYHYRLRFQSKGSAHRRFQQQVAHAQTVVTFSNGKEEDILNTLAAPKEDEAVLNFSHLPPVQQMLIVLLDAGWKLREIEKAFPESAHTIREARDAIRAASCEDPRVQEALGKDTESLLPASQREPIVRKRRVKSASHLPPLSEKWAALFDSELFSSEVPDE